MNLNFKNIKYEILSPGNIFWKKSSGSTVLISKKGDVLNHDLIKKLESGEQTLLIEDGIDFHAHHEMIEVYVKYAEEFLMRDKIRWRAKLIELFRSEFITKDKSQFELNFLAWKFFSNITNEETKQYIERDAELFKRHLNVASSYAICAFLMGYYESSFLKNIFSSTLRNLMDLGSSVHVLTLKERIEYLRQQDSFLEEDVKELESIVSHEVMAKTVMFERYDGSGMRNINSREMSDLEIVMVALNRNYGFDSDEKMNVLSEITKGDFKCEKRTLKVLQSVLHENELENTPAA